MKAPTRLSPILLALLLALSAAAPRPCLAAEPARSVQSIAELVTDPAPWLHMEPYSEQRQPVYLGATPREIELGLAPADKNQALLPEFLRPLGEEQAGRVHAGLLKAGRIAAGEAVEFEAWPVRDDAGRLTWAFARYRLPAGAWKWLDAALVEIKDDDPATPPMLPRLLRPFDPAEFALIFDDFLLQKGLYDKPAFADCLWTLPGDPADLPANTQAWLPTGRMGLMREGTLAKDRVCRVTPQPPRLNGSPKTWVLNLKDGALAWPADLAWKKAPEKLPKLAPGPGVITRWPANFTEAYRKDLLALDGERPARFPLSKKTVRFTAKNNADPNNQLELLVEYLTERYKVLGLPVVRQDFIWRGRPQTNLIAVIKGSLPPERNRPVLLGDHIDTAFCEDEYDRTSRRISAPGADDNVSATATLLRAAEILKGARPLHDIWLTHFTGEEFPADDLGAREFLGRLLKNKQDIGGLVLMDLIGWRARGTTFFQVNPGDNQASLMLAAVVFDAAKALKSRFTPKLRPRFDPRSYLYNTDGLLFSDMGFPVVLLNEHMNRLENLNRVGYHHTTDTSRKIDWEYVTTVAKTAIETAARLAKTPPADAR
jgi:hypothetical protein